MLKRSTLLIPLVAVMTLAMTPAAQAQDAPPFGDPDNVAYAAQVWAQMDGYRHWKMTTPVYKGQSPHGAYLRLYSSFVTVDGAARPIIVKENYGGRGVTAEAATSDPDTWLKAVTIMLQRETGYDADNDNWFWVKYAPDGSVMSNDKGAQLAGRVAKGMPAGCIACHTNAKGGDYLFVNDEE